MCCPHLWQQTSCRASRLAFAPVQKLLPSSTKCLAQALFPSSTGSQWHPICLTAIDNVQGYMQELMRQSEAWWLP